jgi:hypothetical protein
MGEHAMQKSDAVVTRRGALAGGFSLAAALTLPLSVVAAAARERSVAGFRPQWSPTAQQLGEWLKKLHEFGPIRFTGTAQCRAFEEFLATEITRLGFSLERDQYRLMSWSCDLERDCQISLAQDGKPARELEVIAYYPFAATTRSSGPVTGRVLYAGVGDESVKQLASKTSAAELAGAIVVVDMPLAGGGARTVPVLYPDRFPDGLGDPNRAPNPATQGGRPSMEAVEGKCKALILCYTDVSDDAARYNWLPFSDKHRSTPALWVGRAGSEILKAASGQASATLRCDSTLTPDARADTLVATLPGKSDEVVFLTTQTDGPNECNENGGLGLLALATYAAKRPAAERRRTLVVCMPTGHYAFGAVADPVTGSGRRGGTAGAIEKRPELVKRIVAQIALEQMGAMEWVAADMDWKPTGLPAPDMWIPTDKTHEASTRLFMAATQGEDPRFSRAFVVKSGMAPGEGGALRNLGLAGIGLMGTPQYFFRADPKGVIDKLDPRIMKNQMDFATKMMLLMDRLSVDQLNGSAPISDTDLQRP